MARLFAVFAGLLECFGLSSMLKAARLIFGQIVWALAASLVDLFGFVIH